jgi:polyisoprenoid-binding protein YceI
METTKWELDPAHSEIQFKAKHMMISTVSGEFKKFNVDLESQGDDFTKAKATFEADVNSITTKNDARDKHLKSADFFDSEKYPEIKFESEKIEKKGNDYVLTGDLTIKGITRPVQLNVENNGVIKDPYGNQRTGFEITGKINRKDFHLKWNELTETGGMIVGDEIRIMANVELVHQ